MANFSAQTTGVTLTDLGAYKIVNGAPDTGTPLTNSGQLTSTGDSWGSFTDTASQQPDKYSVYFFFSASSLNAGESTYIEPLYNKCQVDPVIIKVTNVTNLYAIKVTFPERYESEAGEATYTSTIVLKTNDVDVHLDKEIRITHRYCKSAS